MFELLAAMGDRSSLDPCWFGLIPERPEDFGEMELLRASRFVLQIRRSTPCRSKCGVISERVNFQPLRFGLGPAGLPLDAAKVGPRMFTMKLIE